MKICFLAPADSGHTIKWCNYFVSKGHEVHVISFTKGEIAGVQIHWIDSGAASDGGDLQKLLYLTKAGQVRKLVRKLKPDVVNAHYATSYGVVAALAGLKNYILSIWGSDVYVFPKRSVLHRLMLQFSLWRAGYLFSTSRAMAEEAKLYTKKEFAITPFGVDVELFSPEKRDRTDGSFVVGTVKTMAPAYGIDTFLKAVKIVREERPEIPLQVRIAGSGPKAEEYKDLAVSLGIDDIVCWLGFIPQEQAAHEWANMDIGVICSNSESFGVSAVEAQACECPIIISDIPGLMEATEPGKSSIVVHKGNEKEVGKAIIHFYDHPEERKDFGKNGRRYIEENYELISCFEKVENLYQEILSKR